MIGNAQVEPRDGLGQHAQFLNEGVFFRKAIVEAHGKGPYVDAGARVGERRPVNNRGYNAERGDAANNGDGCHRPSRRREPAAAAEYVRRRPQLPQGDSRAQSNYKGPAELQRLFEQSR